MALRIFINYRREDSPGTAHRLREPLVREFGRDNVFMDIDIPSGIDFVKYLGDQIAACDIFLAVIGSHWLDSKDRNDQRRLGNPNDFVSVEIVAALARDIRVIPILVDGVRMPTEDEIPARLRPLARRNAIELRNLHLERDAEVLIEAIRNGRSGIRKRSPSTWRRWTMVGTAGATLVLVGWLASARPDLMRWLYKPDPLEACRAAAATLTAKEPARPANGATAVYGVQVSSHRAEIDARCAYEALQAKHPGIFGSHPVTIKRVDLGNKGIFYRAIAGRFEKPEIAVTLCEQFKLVGGQCLVAEL